MRLQCLFVACLIILAGCGQAPYQISPTPSTIESPSQSLSPPTTTQISPTGQPSPSTTKSDSETLLEFQNFAPPFNASLVLERVERLRGLNATAKIIVTTYGRQHQAIVDLPDFFAGITYPGARALGLASNQSVPTTQPLGYTVKKDGVVHIFLLRQKFLEMRNASLELVFVHELVHALQYQHGLLTNNRTNFREAFPKWTTDAMVVSTAIIEGDAMMVTKRYQMKYGRNLSFPSYPRPIPIRGRWQHALGLAPYYFGLQFYQQLSIPLHKHNLLFTNPPNSSRGIVHPSAVDVLPALPSSLAQSGNLDNSFTAIRSDRIGEIVIRRALRVNEISSNVATSAATGWVNGRMVYYEHTSDRVVVRWVTRWRSPTEANEFLTIWQRMLSLRGARRVNGTVVMPATSTTPKTVYILEQNGANITIVSGPSISLVRSFHNSHTT